MIKTINENKPEELLKTMTKNLLFSLFLKKKKVLVGVSWGYDSMNST